MSELKIDLENASVHALTAAISACASVLDDHYGIKSNIQILKTPDVVADATVGVVGVPEKKSSPSPESDASTDIPTTPTVPPAKVEPCTTDSETAAVGSENTSHIEAIIPVSEGGSKVDLDKDGYPWDERIHSSNQKQIAAGTWQLRRKPKDLSDEDWATQVEAVRNELLGVPVDTPAVPGTEPTTSDVPPPPPAAPPVPAAPVALVMTEKAAGATYESFIEQNWTDEMMIEQGYATRGEGVEEPEVALTWPDFMASVTKATAAGTFDPVKMNDLLKADGLEMAELAAKAELLPKYKKELGL